MVGPRIYHVHQTRSYTGFANPLAAFEAMNSWLRSSDFRVHQKSPTFSKGHKRGVHVNFVPKFKLYVEPCGNGATVVKFDYYGKMKVGTLVVVGILTSGISTAVGVATYAMRLLEADQFAASFWSFVDTLARGPITVLKVERWGHDSHGHYVQQPVPVAVQQPAVVLQQPAVVQPVVMQQPYIAPQYPYAQQPYPQAAYAQSYPQQQHQQEGYQQTVYQQTQHTPSEQHREISTAKASDYPGKDSPTQQPNNPSQQNTNSQQPQQIYGHPQQGNFQQQGYPQTPQQPQQNQPQMYYPSFQPPQSNVGGTSSGYPYPQAPASTQ